MENMYTTWMIPYLKIKYNFMYTNVKQYYDETKTQYNYRLYKT